MRQIALSYPVVVGPPTGTDRENQLLSLIRRFTAFTCGYASVPSYGGNACINSRWVNYYIITIVFLRLRRNIHCFARMFPSGWGSTSEACAPLRNPSQRMTCVAWLLRPLRSLREIKK